MEAGGRGGGFLAFVRPEHPEEGGEDGAAAGEDGHPKERQRLGGHVQVQTASGHSQVGCSQTHHQENKVCDRSVQQLSKYTAIPKREYEEVKVEKEVSDGTGENTGCTLMTSRFYGKTTATVALPNLD